MKDKIIENIPYIILFSWLIFILIVWIALNNKDLQVQWVEELRDKYLNTYSERTVIIENNIKELRQERQKIENLIESEKDNLIKIKQCLQANSLTGAVVDCDLYFKNHKGNK